MTFSKFAKVVLSNGIPSPLDYGIPHALLTEIALGMEVKVPLGKRESLGIVTELFDHSHLEKIKSILSITSKTPLLSPQLLTLANWMSSYYLAPLQKVLRVMLPKVYRQEKAVPLQWIVKRNDTRENLARLASKLRETKSPQAHVLDVMLQIKKEIFLTELLEKAGTSRSPVDSLVKNKYLLLEKASIDCSPLLNEEYFFTKKKQLNDEQQQALEKITWALEKKTFQIHLIHGVTGSGKTEVYLQAIDKALLLNKSVIVLVPEIALTEQTIERFKSRFQEDIAILHHRLSDSERCQAFKKIQEGKIRICIGARSSIFCPMKDLGLIIVDEEHEASYKQSEKTPCYNARDIACMRGKIETACVILGSATPSLESYHNAQQGKYVLSTLSKRAASAYLPKVTLIDMNQEKEKGGYLFSDKLLSAMEKRIEKGEQTILFLNRRGYHTHLFCPSCKTKVECSHCALSMTFHKRKNLLSCHLCGFQVSPPPTTCPKCQGETMKYQGAGTEQVERQLGALFPKARLLRMDGDTTKHRGSHQVLYRAFATGKADILIGTQMIAKGLHFPLVTLVGILNADASLHIPDFRSGETTFQIITQVAGRAGRGDFAGEVILQTALPENRIIQLAKEQDYDTFIQEETKVRELFEFPPMTKMIKLTFSGKDEKLTGEKASRFKNLLLSFLPKEVEAYPVLPCSHAKVKDIYRFKCILRSPKTFPLIHALRKALSLAGDPKVHLHIDVDPSTTI